jgi:PAS domain S-box-containing protein
MEAMESGRGIQGLAKEEPKEELQGGPPLGEIDGPLEGDRISGGVSMSQGQGARLRRSEEAASDRTALASSEMRFRLLVESVIDYAIFLLDPEGRISSWNVGAKRVKGYEANEIIGRHFSCFYPEEDIRSGKPQCELEIATKEGRLEDEGWRLRKDGSKFWANVVITALRDESGKLVGFAKVTRDITERMKAQEALRSSNEKLLKEIAEKREAERKLEESEASLRRLSRYLLRSQDEERRRIGRELHDSVGQYVAVLKMNLDSLKSSEQTFDEQTRQRIEECARLAEDAITEVRTISYLLYPPMLEEMGLKSAIPWYLEGFAQRSGIKTSFETSPDFDRLPRDVELAVFRVLQESLTNVHRHSKSPTAHVRVHTNNGEVILEVRDEGKGIPAEVLKDSTQEVAGALGVGLRGMNERTRQLRGSLQISSSNRGTTVRATIPCAGDTES